jgi:hypothetical protein
MNINHRPQFPVEHICEHYSVKDGVPVKYVCTTETDRYSDLYDIFYRDTPHPKFGNRYFGIYCPQDRIIAPIIITNADWVESLDFTMIEHEGQWHYSQYTHDFHAVGPYYIDGGRSCGRIVGSSEGMPESKVFIVRDGEFVEKEFADTL